MKPKCESCRWWQPRQHDVKGECHESPPSPLGFVLTHPVEWCGRFAKTVKTSELSNQGNHGKE